MSRRKLKAAVLVLVGLGFLGVCQSAHSKEGDWLPFAPQDLAMKDNPLSPGSAAMILYREAITDDPDSYETHYYRIKVFTEAGKKYGDVEIPYLKDNFRITDLKARTIHPDGTIVNFEGQPFDKMVVKTRRVSFLAKTFTLPDVQVGSILEYRYTLRWDPQLLYATRWIVQHELFTRKAHFEVKPNLEGGYYFKWISLMPATYGRPTQQNGSTFQMDVENIPGVAEEKYMPPEDEVKARVLFYYSIQEQETPDQFWKREGKEWYESAEKFIGKRKEIQQEAAADAPEGDAPEVRLRKLYARAQQIRNLSYERSKTEAEQKQEDLKDNKNVEDVLKHGYGYRGEINRLFVGLARAAGFGATVIRIAERDDNFFHHEFLEAGQLNGEVAVVRVGEQDLYLDAGTPHCPFGLLSWEKTGVRGIRLDKDGGAFVLTPNPRAEDAVEQRKAVLHMDEDGTLTGSVSIAYSGQRALSERLDAMDTDETGRRKAMEDEIKALLPSTTEVKLGKVSGLEVSEGPVTVEATVEIAGFGTATGRRLLLPLALFEFNSQHPFQYAERVNPVYLHSPFEESDDVELQVPAGYQVESLPPAQNESTPFGSYAISWEKRATGGLHLHRQFALAGFFFPAGYYPNLRGFYSKVTAGDSEQVVVQHGQVGAR